MPSDKPPIKTPGELAIERGEPWPKPMPEPAFKKAIAQATEQACGGSGLRRAGPRTATAAAVPQTGSRGSLRLRSPTTVRPRAGMRCVGHRRQGQQGQSQGQGQQGQVAGFVTNLLMERLFMSF